MSDMSHQRLTFSFNWSIENFSMCALDSEEYLCSPVFIVDLLEKSEWCLQVYAGGCRESNDLGCFLKRIGTGIESDIKTIGFSLTVAAVDSSLDIKNRVERHLYRGSIDWGFHHIICLEELFQKKHVYLPNDVLTLRCCMWQIHNDFTSIITSPTTTKSIISQMYNEDTKKLSATLSREMCAAAKGEMQYFQSRIWPQQCSARTRIRVEHRSITWPITRFSQRGLQEKVFISLRSPIKDSPSLILALKFQDDGSGDDNVKLEIHSNVKSKQMLVKCTVTILDVKSGEQESLIDDTLFEAGIEDDDFWQLLPLIKRSKLLAEKDLYLKDDVLCLSCDFAISYKGDEHHIETKISSAEEPNHSHPKEIAELKQDFLCAVYNDKNFCDVTLKVGDQEFLAHKGILCAISPVFTAMFKNDMKEKHTGLVDITDLDSETLDRLLKFMYLGKLEDMEQKDGAKLYSAADKYQVLPLKQQCSDFLKSTLALPNVCEVLALADSHQDKELKTSAMKFISMFPNEIFPSSDWKNLMEDNIRLAGDAMHWVLMKTIS